MNHRTVTATANRTQTTCQALCEVSHIPSLTLHHGQGGRVIITLVFQMSQVGLEK